VHIATVKGKGFAPAEEGGLEGMEKWHAAKPKSIANGAPVAAAKSAGASPPQYTTVFGQAMVDEVRRDRRVVGITAAMNSGTGLNILQKEEPDHYFDVGIAEQQAVLFAAGLSLEGVKPSARSTRRSCSAPTTRSSTTSACRSSTSCSRWTAPVLVGDDGPTHHGVFDIAYMRSLPNMVCMAPRDEAMLPAMLRTALTYDGGPICLRYPRGEGVGVPGPAARRGTRGSRSAAARSCAMAAQSAIVGYGTGRAEGRSRRPTSSPSTASDVTVADARFAKPIDLELMQRLAPITSCS
jgi:1-deoxy-D-xylulose-5-phosphate synthase